MKVYVKPEVELVEFLVEENITNTDSEAGEGFSGTNGNEYEDWDLS